MPTKKTSETASSPSVGSHTGTTIWRWSALLLVASALAGLLNYAAQVRAAKTLTVADFGLLNSWIANTMTVLSICAFCQTCSMYFSLTRRAMINSCLTLLAMILVTSAAFIYMLHVQITSPWAWTFATLPLGIISGWLSGQLQLRLQFAAIAISGLVGALAKFSILIMPWTSPSSISIYFLAFTLSLAISAVVLVVYGFTSRKTHSTPLTAQIRVSRKIAGAAILTVSAAILPNMDVICLRMSQSIEVVGEYSRAALFSKASWFFAAAILQITLPLKIRGETLKGSKPLMWHLWLIETLVLIGGILGAIAAAVLGPTIAYWILDFDLQPYRVWIALSCLSASCLYLILSGIQVSCANLNWQLGAKMLSGAFIWIIWWTIWRNITVNGYLACAMIYYTSLIGISAFAMPRHYRVPGRRPISDH